MWQLHDQVLDNKTLLKNESLFTLANGYLGVRGNFEEGYQEGGPTIRGTYINAFYDDVPISYGESAYGYPMMEQKLINIIDAQGLVIFLDGERVNLFSGLSESYSRVLHMDQGYSERSFIYHTKNRQKATIRIRRMVSFIQKELFLIEVHVTYRGKVTIQTMVDLNVRNFSNQDDPRLNHGESQFLNPIKAVIEDGVKFAISETKTSKLMISCVSKDCYDHTPYETHEETSSHLLKSTYVFEGDVLFTKYSVYTDTRRHLSVEESGIAILNKAINQSFSSYLTLQQHYLAEFWKVANIEIDGDQSLQQGLRFNLFQLLQSIGKEKLSNISAKGLTGEGYEGHYFWDTEIYIFPLFLMISPDLAKNLLLYRYSILDKARVRAKEMGHKKGALYPWRTITGSECSGYFPAGTAQYHINADIAYSFIQYEITTQDEAFMIDYGAEVIFETARVYAEIAHLQNGLYHIHTVTGPDEYTALVNNNYYTNVMVKHHLRWAKKIYDQFKSDLTSLIETIHLSEEEVALWQDISKRIYLPYDETLKINPQDDSFLNKAIWDFEHTPKENYPLLLHYHPLTIYRYQVCKQADTVLAHFLLEDEQSFETIEHSYRYYEKVTTHDSSLSSCIFSIMACKINDLEASYRYFLETSRMDLDNTHGNTKDGLHMANMGGAWMAVVYGFGGLRIKEDGIHLNPKCPKEINGYQFSLKLKASIVHIHVNKQGVLLECIEGEDIKLFVNGKKYHLLLNKPLIMN